MQNSIGETAAFIKKMLPVQILNDYSLNGSYLNMRKGIPAFRDFLIIVYDRLTAAGAEYAQPNTAKKAAKGHLNVLSSHPFLNYVKSVMFNIGYHGTLAEDGAVTLQDGIEPLLYVVNAEGGQKKEKIPESKFLDCVRFLSDCGLSFSEPLNNAPLKISYPSNPFMLTGMKVIALAQKQPHSGSNDGVSLRCNDDVFLRCDYRVLKDGGTDVASLFEDFLRVIPAAARDFAAGLHRRYVDKGLVCKAEVRDLTLRFYYFHKNKEIWAFTASPSYGCCLHTKAVNAEKYAAVIKDFSAPLRALIANGFGCEKKRFGGPCQKGCHGYKLQLDEPILVLSRDIETWLDNEVLCLNIKG